MVTLNQLQICLSCCFKIAVRTLIAYSILDADVDSSLPAWASIQTHELVSDLVEEANKAVALLSIGGAKLEIDACYVGEEETGTRLC